MAANPTPQAGINSIVSIGGTAVVAVPAGALGGVIQNPLMAADQGIANSEPLYINPVSTATTVGNGTTFAIPPGESWQIIPNQTTITSVNAVTSGHKFSVVWF